MITFSIESRPAILGGKPLADERLGIVKPCLPSLDQIKDPLSEILTTGNLTNHSCYVREFERGLREYLGIPHALAVGNATLGLILALAGLKLEGEVILPSFTFSATAHAIHWNRLKPVFVDILPDTFTLDPSAIEAAITPNTSAILPVHIFGHPCEVFELERIAEKHGLAVLFDAAHAFGSKYRGQRIGCFGDAEIFSFHATKIFPVGEGGCISTQNDSLAEFLMLGRKFGDPGNGDTLFPGINAKMQEFNAILGLEALKVIDRHIVNRHRYAAELRERLKHIPGIGYQFIRPYVHSNYQNFAILIDADQFGVSRDLLYEALLSENIHPRKYFYPSLHLHTTYAHDFVDSLPVTELVSSQVLCLPFYSEMNGETLDILCLAIERIHSSAPQIRKGFRS
jgi:dTDP-4-amino-4,6-dideoxygalactose transaminase